MIEIRQMKHILAVAKYGNFKRASESVFLSQPALSLSIKSAEEWFGQKLFERGHRKVVPTAFGEIVIKLAENTIAAIDDTLLQVKQISGLEGSSIRIGLSPLCSEMIGDKLIKRLLNQFPKNTFQIISNVLWQSSVSSIKNNLFDLAVEIFAFDPHNVFYNDPAINYINLEVPGLVYYCRAGHPITKLEEITYNDLTSYPFAIQPLPPLFLQWLIKATDLKNEADLGNNVKFISNDRGFLRAAVLHSDCISGSPYSLIAKELNAGIFNIIDVKWKIPHLENKGSILYSAERPLTPLSRKTTDIIIELLTDLKIEEETIP